MQLGKTVIHLNSSEIQFDVIAAHGEAFEFSHLWLWWRNAGPVVMGNMCCALFASGPQNCECFVFAGTICRNGTPEAFKAGHSIHRKQLILMELWIICCYKLFGSWELSLRYYRHTCFVRRTSLFILRFTKKMETLSGSPFAFSFVMCAWSSWSSSCSEISQYRYLA